MKAFYKMIVAAVAAGVFVNAYSKVILPSFYADNMVLQQKALMTVKGKAIPNSTVKFKASWDYALAKAVGWNAKVILSVPCCQHELNRQMENEVLAPIFRYGLLKERMAALVTDGLRAQYLERWGTYS